jgi:hypothetical protein
MFREGVTIIYNGRYESLGDREKVSGFELDEAWIRKIGIVMMFLWWNSVFWFFKVMNDSLPFKVIAKSSKENDFSFMFLMDFWIIWIGFA